MPPVLTSSIAGYPLFRRGKVRDVYDLGDRLLMVATDRISAFDVVMSQPVPDKGALLTQISTYWFNVLGNVVPNHLITTDVFVVEGLTPEERRMLAGRSMVVEKTEPLPVECVVRGYLAGSGWKEYRTDGTVCGIEIPAGYQESAKLEEPIFTPATKAETGHDENIPFETAAQILGEDTARFVRDISIRLYTAAAEHVAAKGLILADTKFEFGRRSDGSIILIDEALTPDSSRYWLASEYEVGRPQHNFDKQILRDYLETTTWNKQAPPPPLPDHVISGTRAKYLEAYERITGHPYAAVSA
jgi:phosphoribosylaminoimidazole-succinocarboxamide synthase